MSHSKLLNKTDNKYQLVLEIARRAKIIKDEVGKSLEVETTKPIPLAIQNMMDEEEVEGQPEEQA